MPKITTHGGASNAREAIDPAVVTAPSSASPSGDGPTVELTRDEDPHAPAARPGEHTPFFSESADEPAERGSDEHEGDGTPEGSDESVGAPRGGEGPTVPTSPDGASGVRPAKKAAKRTGGAAGSGGRDMTFS